MIQSLFPVCGIKTKPGQVRNDEFLKKIMNFVKDKLAEEKELLEGEDLFSCV